MSCKICRGFQERVPPRCTPINKRHIQLHFLSPSKIYSKIGSGGGHLRLRGGGGARKNGTFQLGHFYSSSAPWSEWDKPRGTFFLSTSSVQYVCGALSDTALDTQTVLCRELEVFSPHGVWQAFCHLLFKALSFPPPWTVT